MPRPCLRPAKGPSDSLASGPRRSGGPPSPSGASSPVSAPTSSWTKAAAPGGSPTDEALLYYEEVTAQRRDPPVIILLHGRGADERDLLPIVPYIAKGWNAVSIRAPLEFPMGGFAWYEFVPNGGPERASFQESLARLSRTL